MTDVRAVVALLGLQFCTLYSSPAHADEPRAELSAKEWREGCQGTFDEALKEAASSKRWLLVDVFATWCGPCHQMDEQVYSRDEVANVLKNQFVFLRRDGEKAEGLLLAERYHAVGFPTLLVLDATGKEIDRVMGFVAASELTALLARFRADHGTLAELERRLASNPKDEALRLEVGIRHAYRGDSRAVSELSQLAQVTPTDSQDKRKRAANALLTLGKYYYLRGAKDYPHAISTLIELTHRFAESEEADQAPYNLAIAYHGLKQDGEARALLDRWLAEKPKEVSRYNSYAWLSFKNGFDLSRGIEVAKKGLEIDPKEDGLWDTLGELQAATGHLVEARQAEAKALSLKPQDRYYAAQLRRFAGSK